MAVAPVKKEAAGQNHVGNLNPFRYRGYYLDIETGLYYLNNRYYDTQTGRFINSDSAMGNTVLVIVGVDAAVLGEIFLDMYKDSKGVYHAKFDCWQQYFGYNDFYDSMFDLGTSMKSSQFKFTYNGTNYVIWAWKGDYINLGAGAELGIYYGGGLHWFVDKSLAMDMSLYVFYKNFPIISYAPGQKQWWITGFNPSYLNVQAGDLSVLYRLQFNSLGLYFTFLDAYNGEPGWAFVPQYLVALYAF